MLETLLSAAESRGSAALRTYNSFVYPKSAGALANAEKPGRVHTIAQSIAFYERERRAANAEWLRNVDAAQKQIPHGTRQPISLVLDNIRSAANVGNLLRAAEAARVTHVYLCGITPSPPNAKVLKTALGSAELVPHSSHGSTISVVRELQDSGVRVWACETTERAIDLRHAELPQPLAFVLGNELIGVDVDVIAICDEAVQIPCLGVKNSLNVATAGTVMLWEAMRQWGAAE